MRKISVPEDGVETLFGSYDENLRQLESTFGVRISTQGHDLIVEGAPADEARVERTVNKLTALMREGYRVANGDVKTAAQLVSENADVDLQDFLVKGPVRRGQAADHAEEREPAALPRRDRPARHRLRRRTGRHGQDLPGDGAGRHVPAQKEGQPHHPRAACRRGRREARVPARRPAGEGESVPAARSTTPSTTCSTSSASSGCSSAATIEVAPIAFMRGRTLNDSFVILDEAQNTTSEQMKMFLTRLGFGSKAVVTGDITQIDLPTGQASGLVEAMKIVSGDRGHLRSCTSTIATSCGTGSCSRSSRPTKRINRATAAAPLSAVHGRQTTNVPRSACRSSTRREYACPRPGLRRWLARASRRAPRRATVTVAIVPDARVRA